MTSDAEVFRAAAKLIEQHGEGAPSWWPRATPSPRSSAGTRRPRVNGSASPRRSIVCGNGAG
jgi:hypothetical protein